MENHHEKLGLKRIPCAGRFTILDTAGTSADRVGNYTDTRSSKPNRAWRTTDVSYPLESSVLFPPSSCISLSCPQLYHHHKDTKMSHPSRCLHAMIKS